MSLAVREPSTFIEPERRVARLAGCVVGLLLTVVASTGGDGRVVVWSSVAVMLGVAGVVEWQQRRIVSRARPALPADLAAADAVVRREAIDALHHAGNGLVCLLLANAFAAAAGTGDGAFAVLVGFVLFVTAVVEWRRSRLWIVTPGPHLGAGVA